jgi:hypothetical protein
VQYLLTALVLCTIVYGCRSSKQSVKGTKSPTDSTQVADTSKSEASRQFDSVKNKISGFLSSLLPPKQDTARIGADELPPKSDVKNPAVTPELPNSGGFLSTPIRRRVEFDSSGQVIIHNQFLNSDVDVPMTMSFQDYLAYRKNQEIDDAFRNSIHTTQDTTKIKDQGLFPTDFNQITIPIPPSIVPSIFGKPSINLRVNGDVAVHIAYRDNQFLQTQGAQFSGSETGLDFKQEINVSTSGTIGDKMKIGADWGSERSFQYENLLKLGYTGFPDEIIQSIEAGNVSLVTPSQYIGIQQALFGLKAVTRFGPLYLTELVAQKKGDRQSKSFGGGAGSGTATEHIIQPASYRRNSFFVDTLYFKYYEPYYALQNGDKTVNTGADLIAPNIEVWRQVSSNVQPQANRLAVAWYQLGPGPYGPNLRVPPISTTTDTLVQSGTWIKLDTNQYSIQPNTGVLTLSQEPSDEDVIAMSYTTNSGATKFGESQSNPGTLVLKLIKPKHIFIHPNVGAWKNILKNSYYIGGSSFNRSDFGFRVIFTRPTGQEVELIPQAGHRSQKVISALGLDRYNNSHSDNSPDGLFDNDNHAILDERLGTVTFPYLQPFGTRIVQYFQVEGRKDPKVKFDSTFYFPQLYTQQPDILRTQVGGKNNQISLNAKFTGGVSSLINLNAFNLVEGSVRVTINGNQLAENIDYRVDYNSGTVQILRPDLVSTGNVNIDYETHDIFTNATKSVLGLRGDIPILDRGLIGFTFMNYSLQLPSLKTRQGEEPLSNWIAGFDASYTVPAPFITDALNALPFFNLKEKSQLTAKVDVAVSLPRPNTQVSPMPVDNNAPIAYLDDFEGGKNIFPLSMSYGKWVHASQPVYDRYKFFTVPDTITVRKAKTWWYERYPQDVLVKDIRPNRSTSRPGDVAQVMDVVYDPAQQGTYNHSSGSQFNSTDPADRWGGLMQYAPGLNVPATNTDAIEFWMQVPENGGDPTGVIRFDIGRISEDVIPDGKLETEDANLNGRYDPGEDIGLDTMTDAQEQAAYPNALHQNDPNNDNYNYVSGSEVNDYQSINGTEGNQNDRASLLHPDTEDLDGNSSVNLDNNYYEYRIPINPVNNKFVVGSSPAGWYQYRIPLASFDSIVGIQDSSFSDISYFRFWFTGFKQRVRLRLNEVSLVGSQWTRGLTGLNPVNPVTDTSLRISYVNIEDNSAAPTNYTGPDGVARDRLPGQTNFILGNEQSLDMSLLKIKDTTSREAVRNFQTPNDLFNYKSLAIWVHGDNAEPSQNLLQPNNGTFVYVRIGTNPFNYYEYRRPLGSGWQNIHIDFGALTSLKAAKLNSAGTITQPANDGVTGSTYSVVGSPTFTNAPFFVLGVTNHTGHELTTDVWWDELRLLSPNVKPDYAFNAQTQLKLAEFGRISASMVNERPDFVRVDERFNQNRSLNFNWNITGEFAMQKIFPKWLENQSVFPLTVSHTESILRPKYLPNTDVEIQGAVDKIQEQINNHNLDQATGSHLQDSIRLVSESLSVKNSIGATGVKFVFPGSFFLLPAFVNRLVYGFGYAEEYARTPQYEFNRSWSWTASLGYDLPALPDLHLSPFTWWGTNSFFIGRYADYKINFLPSNVRFAVSATRGRKHSLDRVSTLEFPLEATLQDTLDVLNSRKDFINRNFTVTRGMQFQWKPTEGGLLSPAFDYGLDVTSNLAPLETRNSFLGVDTSTGQPIYYYDSVSSTQRAFSEILRDVFFKNGALVRPGNDYQATQRVNMTTNPKLPWFFGLEKLVRPVFSYHVDYRWEDAQTGIQTAKTGAWNNTITTGLELNVRDLGVIIFGKPVADEQPQRGRGGPRDRMHRDEPINPEELPQQGREDRTSAPPKTIESPRNQVDRGEEFRPQSRPNPLGNHPLITDTLLHGRRSFGDIDTTHKAHIPGVGTAGERDQDFVSDTTLTPTAPITDEPDIVEKPAITLKEILQDVIQKPLFDWNGTRFNFVQNNTSLNPALQGNGSGITNFFARGIFSPEEDNNGPSRAYQLGLITDPHGRLLIGFKNRFPFITFNVKHGGVNNLGLRANDIAQTGSQITDVFTQQNNFELSTSRPLWDGANLSLNWKVQFSYDERNSENLDAAGNIFPNYTTRSGDVSRTIFSIPYLPFLKSQEASIDRVYQKYVEMTAQQGANNPVDRAKLPPEVLNRIEVQSFMQGFETLPFFNSFLREYLPRLNYSFNWVGLEKFFLFAWADHASFRHAYNGTYRRSFRENPGDSLALTNLQTVVYGFRPLIALDLSWEKIFGGHMTASLNYDTQTEWASDYSSQRINKRLSNTFGITANYSHQGVSIPFLKLNLKNEFGASFTVSYTNSADSYFTFDNIGTLPGGTGNGGLEKLTIEPRISYTVSQQLTLEGFYRYERTTPASSGQLAPPTRLIMAGIDIRLKIQ